MARLHEYQGKTLLRDAGIAVPRGVVVRAPREAADALRTVGDRAVMKVQAWVTGRKSRGGVVFVEDENEAVAHAEKLLSMTFGNFPVTEILVEEVIDIARELFVSISIDDAAQAPILLLDAAGGTGIEDRAESVARLPISVIDGVDDGAVRTVLGRAGIDAAHHDGLADAIATLVKMAGTVEARSLEVNPLVVTRGGTVVAADCRMTIDDYAVFRHPELGIAIAREELDHPATDLERVAYQVEADDHRGTFYFAQLPTDGAANTKGLVGFHGAGGGGSMMSMDAVTHEGFTLANFCDTSGNPSAAKVYRAARIILSQPGLVGYFGSGSGVASQEQFHSAYGLAKAFLEMGMAIPAVIRLGGNSEDRAVTVLEDACRDLPATIEGYKKDDTPAFCAERFATLVAGAGTRAVEMKRTVPAFVGAPGATSFEISGGRVWIDAEACDAAITKIVVEHASGLMAAGADGRPELGVDAETVMNKDSELIACEIECRRAGAPVVFVDLDLPAAERAADCAGAA